ncbi:DnaD domain protein [Cytobacillus sp. FJAT-54145]|uniref:DnaD domain protein n=1 Tax=Cytobacillus spartinae TaxID=3299023 RepID=A0ABW6KD63_9BACI
MKDNILQWFQEGNITFPGALLANYKKMNIDETELVLLLQVHSFIEKGNGFPTPNDISSRMTISVPQCNDMLRKLIQKGLIEIQDGHGADGIRFEKYSLIPLWNKLIENFLLTLKGKDMEKKQREESDVYSTFEQEFGRPLSPFECETLAMWMDDDRHDPIIIKSALREAVVSGKLNFRYIDRILFEWKKNGIKTIEQAKSYGRKFRQFQTQQRVKIDEEKTQTPSVPFYNWLDHKS